jgi:anti-sigma factor RsiW
MTCEEVGRMLDAYVDENCSPEERTAIEAHLHSCTSCASEALRRLQMKRATRAAAARYSPSPDFRRRIEESIRAKQRPAHWFSWGRPLAALATAMLVVAVSIGLWTRHTAREQAMTELLDLHVAIAASSNPVDVVSSDRHTVKPWFQGKLPFAFNLPELANTPYTLIGGKLVFLGRNPSAQLLFSVRKHDLSVFIAEQNRSFPMLDSRVHSDREKGFSTESWVRDGLRYVIISDTSPQDVRALGELLRSAANQ